MNKDKIKLTENSNETSYSRIYQRTQDDSTFAIIGSEDKDTGDKKYVGLVDLVRKLSYKQGKGIGFNNVCGTYTYKREDKELITLVSELSRKSQGINKIAWNNVKGTYKYQDTDKVTLEKSLIIYNITKKQALDIANKLNLEILIWKDPNFFGILNANGSVEIEFQNEEDNKMNFSNTGKVSGNTKLMNDKQSKLEITFEGYVQYPLGYNEELTEEDLREYFKFVGKRYE